MAKRKPNSYQPNASSVATVGVAPIVANPPAKHPSLLAVSLVLFALWFVFLLVAAIWQ